MYEALSYKCFTGGEVEVHLSAGKNHAHTHAPPALPLEGGQRGKKLEGGQGGRKPEGGQGRASKDEGSTCRAATYSIYRHMQYVQLTANLSTKSL